MEKHYYIKHIERTTEPLSKLSIEETTLIDDKLDTSKYESIFMNSAYSGGKVSWKEIAPMVKNLAGEAESNRHAIRGYCSAILLNGTDNKQAALILECFKDKYMDRNDFCLAAYSVFMG